MAKFPGAETPSEDDLGLRLAKAQLDLVLGLREVRISKGMSVQDVAAKMGVDPAQVSRIESGGTNPTMASVRRYAAAVGALFNVRVRDFVQVRESEKASAILQARFREAMDTTVAEFQFLDEPISIGLGAESVTTILANDPAGSWTGLFKHSVAAGSFAEPVNIVGMTQSWDETPIRIKKWVGPHHRSRLEKKVASK